MEGGGDSRQPSARVEIRLFISYSWDDKILRQLLVKKLKAAGYKTLCDEEFIRAGDELNKRILSSMDEAHGLVALLTKSALESVAVREELTRAHSQHLRICALVERGARDQLPWFIKGSLYFEYSSQSDDFRQILNGFVAHLGTQPLADYESVALARRQFIELYRVWKREVPGTALRTWQLELARRVIENACTELSSMNTHQFSSIVGGGHNFLMRAGPVFENASSVYAVSLDTVSQFWMSEEREDQRVALEYWRAQPPNTYRLFVCTTPESAHDYSTILNIHARRYGDKGRVFLCSATDYKRLMASIGMASDHQDFAVLEYPTANGPAVFKATLDAERFTVIREPGNAVVKQMTEFKRALMRFATLDPGEIDCETGILRWRVDIQKDLDDWAEKLKVIFGSHRPDLFHIVFIARSALERTEVKQKLGGVLREIRTLLGKIRGKSHRIQLKDFWFGDYCQVLAVDSGTSGKIINNEAAKFPCMLLMRFEDEDSLRNWYGDAAHSTLRRKIYEILDARLPELFDAIDQGAPAAATYEQIENTISDHLTRRDYRESDTIDDIVRRTEFKPSIHFD